MNRLNSIALLAGGALVAVAATGCAASAKSAASGPAAGSAASSNSSASSGAAGSTSSPAPGTGSGSAPAGGSSSGANSGASSSAAPGGASSAAPPVSHPVCDNAGLNATLVPAGSGQKPSVAVIAVKNVGPTCTVGPIPYLWIVTSPTDVSNETRPLVPTTDSGKKNIILSGTTLYAAIDLNPDSADDTAGNYGYLEVTANPTKDTSGKDVQDVRLASPAGVAKAMLGVYALSPASAISQIQYATTPEQ